MEFNAKIHLFETVDGGRGTPLESGYRSLLQFSDSEIQIGFELQMKSGPINPGQAGVGVVRVWVEEGFDPPPEGKMFDILEGNRKVGYGIARK